MEDKNRVKIILLGLLKAGIVLMIPIPPFNVIVAILIIINMIIDCA